jgi:uncharacterized protein YodC (DUF2158 family)
VARVFLSHTSADKPVVRRIAAALRTNGHEPWLDEEKILVGESIPAAIERGLREADFVVICLSKAAAERGWLEAERDATLIQQFRERTERILPVRLEEVALPHLIAAIAYVDLFTDEQAFNQGIVRLMRSIEAYLARETNRGNTGAASARTTVGTGPPGGEASVSRARARPVGESKSELCIRDVVFLRGKSPITLHDYMTVSGSSDDSVHCIWVDERLTRQRGTFALHHVEKCDVPRPRALMTSQLRLGSTVGLPSGGLNNGMIVESVDGEQATCSWINKNGGREQEVFAIEVLELLD